MKKTSKILAPPDPSDVKLEFRSEYLLYIADRDYGKKRIELLFDDYTTAPYCLGLSYPEQIDRLPKDAKHLQKFKFFGYREKQIFKKIPKVCFFEYSNLPNLKSI